MAALVHKSRTTTIIMSWLALVYSSEVRVTTTEGIAVGYMEPGKDYIQFLGVPYAGPVKGNFRFRGPAEPILYQQNGVLYATNNSIRCAQPEHSDLVGTEDCLTLDIYTKNTSTSKPVLVWLDGEHYKYSNNKLFSYTSLVQSDVVAIAVNYRLSIFGFLCLGVPEAPGNAGLKDVVAALKWIRANAAAFGGDRNNVVLLGHGSGAAMVDLLTMSPLSKGLVHKAIALSGSALSPWAVAYDPVGYAQALGTKLGFEGMSNSELAKAFVKTDARKLIKAINTFKYTDDTVLFAPCLEHDNTPGSFLTEDPNDILESGTYDDIPYINSFVNLEGTLRVVDAVNEKWLVKMKDNFKEFLQGDLLITNEYSREKVSNRLRSLYFGANFTSDNFLDYASETSIIFPVKITAQKRAKRSAHAVRMLEFAIKEEPDLSMGPKIISKPGTRHGHIRDYILDRRIVQQVTKTTLVRRIVAFAKTGVPITDSGLGCLVWLPLSKDETFYFYYGGDVVNYYSENTKLIDDEEDRWKYWRKIFKKYRRIPIAVRADSSASKLRGPIYVLVLYFIIILLGNRNVE